MLQVSHKATCHLIVFKCTDSPTLGSKSPMPRGSAMISVKSNDQCWLSIFIGLNEFILRFRWTYEMNRSNLLAMASNLRAMASNLVVPQKAVHCTSLIHVLKSGPFTRLVLKNTRRSSCPTVMRKGHVLLCLVDEVFGCLCPAFVDALLSG